MFYDVFSFVSPFFHRQARRFLDNLKSPKDLPPYEPKIYKRFPRIVLPEVLSLTSGIDILLQGRTSYHEFSSTVAPTLTELSTILLYGFGNKAGTTVGISDTLMRRFYPSGGARYPLECYVLMQGKKSELDAGLYHYVPGEHILEKIYDPRYMQDEISRLLTYSWSKDASVILFITAIWGRTMIKYGDFGYHIVLLEAGHASQNVLLISEALGIKSCPLGGFKYDETCDFLDIDGITEAPLYAIVLGKIK